MKSFADVRSAARNSGRKKMAVVWPHDADSLCAALDACRDGLVEPHLFGTRAAIEAAAETCGGLPRDVDVTEAENAESAAELAVRAVSDGRAELLMKGLLDTSVLLSAVLNAQYGLRSGRVLSHVAVFDVPGFPRLLFLSDAAMNIAPDLAQKRQIIENAAEVARAIGVAEPRVAVLCAKEKVNPKMPATVDAAELVRMNREGEISGCIVGGPLALDNAVSPEAAMLKGIDDPVAGVADVLITPDIEAGNILYKALAFLARAENAGVIVGAHAPVVLTSRADSREAKLNSIALAVLNAAWP